jgi:hypothetical protein
MQMSSRTDARQLEHSLSITRSPFFNQSLSKPLARLILELKFVDAIKRLLGALVWIPEGSNTGCAGNADFDSTNC